MTDPDTTQTRQPLGAVAEPDRKLEPKKEDEK